jgi:hypothetical protein
VNILRRWLGLHRIHSPESDLRTETSSSTLERERQEYRQTLQRLDSGARLMKNWANANKMMRGQE